MRNRNTLETVSRLREEVVCLSLSQRQQQIQSGKPPSNLNCIAGDPQAANAQLSCGKCDSRELNAVVESTVKRKISGLMDEVYNIKKKIMGAECNFKPSQPCGNKDTALLPRGRVNYASEQLGARIIRATADPIGGTNIIKKLLGLDFSVNPPINMLRQSLSPGSCFGFNGCKATVSLRLSNVIVVEEIRLTHIAKEMTPNVCVDSAPKNFEVYGKALDSDKQELLGSWTYDNDSKKRSQSYIVNCKCLFQNLVIIFSSNHGATSTCIYHFEVFGRLS
ncbi:spag4 [Drosophila busckii]|uniref:Spag4 n=1 Tax=Drosophila busckii TaxID=30019 RepID=A0A0M5J8P0_DROBS|nr:spag4 [Drosophila busckii]